MGIIKTMCYIYVCHALSHASTANHPLCHLVHPVYLAIHSTALSVSPSAHNSIIRMGHSVWPVNYHAIPVHHPQSV